MEGIFKFWQNVETRAKQVIPPQVFPAVVKEVDEELRTCTVRINDNVDFEEVRLYALPDDSLKGFCLIPAVDSTVLVARIAGCNDLFVTSFSVVDKVIGTIGDKVDVAMDAESLSYKNDKVTFEIKGNKVFVKADEIVFNEGDKDENNGGNGGLIKISKLTEKINELVDSFNSHTHSVTSEKIGTISAPTGGGPCTGTLSVPAPESETNKLDKNDYEDTKIKH